MSLTWVDQRWIFHYITEKWIGLFINTLRHFIPTFTFFIFHFHFLMALLLATNTSLLALLAMWRILSTFVLPHIRQKGSVAPLPSPLHRRPAAPLLPHHHETFTQSGEHLQFLGFRINDFLTVSNSLVFMGSLKVTLPCFSLQCYL